MKQEITIEFDEEAKALYLKLSSKQMVRTKTLYETGGGQSILVDLDYQGKIVGVELLGIDKSNYEIKKLSC